MEKGIRIYHNKHKLITVVLAFAFFWLVIGDLVAIHQKLIYGFDPFGTHQPFSKPAKNESQTHFKVKEKRTVNKSLSFLSLGTALLPKGISRLQSLFAYHKRCIPAISIHRRIPVSILSSRAPPAIS